MDNPFFGIVNNGVLVSNRVARGQLLRPYPQFTDIIPLFSSGSSSIYHALQATVTKRFSRGLQFEGSYSWAKNMDNGMNHQDSYNIRASKALADIDIQQRFVMSYLYELPFGRGKKFGANASGPVNWLLGGWQVNGITTLQSGTPLSFSANNTAGHFQLSDVAEQQWEKREAGRTCGSAAQCAFDRNVFSQPAPVHFRHPDAAHQFTQRWNPQFRSLRLQTIRADGARCACNSVPSS